jgi:hypothetical protein
MSGIVYNSLT